MLFALLLGMAFHFLHESGGRCVAGIEFSSRTILRDRRRPARRARNPFRDLQPGRRPHPDRGLRRDHHDRGGGCARGCSGPARFGVLSGGSVAICGASAALAIASVLPDKARNDSDTIFTVVDRDGAVHRRHGALSHAGHPAWPQPHAGRHLSRRHHPRRRAGGRRRLLRLQRDRRHRHLCEAAARGDAAAGRAGDRHRGGPPWRAAARRRGPSCPPS